MENNKLKIFYNSLGKALANEFREKVKTECDWNARQWQLRVNGEVELTKLEGKAVDLIIEEFKPKQKEAFIYE